MDFQLVCEGATSVPVITGTLADACTAAGGVVVWSEPMSVIPELTLAGAAQIAGAVAALWAAAWAFRVISRQLQES